MESRARVRVLILDFDGVILESNGLKTDVFREVFARFPEHAAAMMEWHLAHISLSRYAKFEHLVFERLGRKGDRALIDELADDFSRRIREHMRGCPEVPGALEFLEATAGRVPVYLASVTPEYELLSVLEARRLRRYFTEVFGCPPWSKPEVVKNIVERHHGSAGILLVGDSPGDRDAAGSSNVEFIARDSGIAFDPPPSQVFPDMKAVAAAVIPRLS